MTHSERFRQLKERVLKIQNRVERIEEHLDLEEEDQNLEQIENKVRAIHGHPPLPAEPLKSPEDAVGFLRKLYPLTGNESVAIIQILRSYRGLDPPRRTPAEVAEEFTTNILFRPAIADLIARDRRGEA